MSAPSLFLASASPRRTALLHQIGVPHTVLAFPGIDETPRSDESAAGYVQRMAQEKARAGYRMLAPGQSDDAVVMGADTAVISGDVILGKPADDEEAVAMLTRLSGATHQVLSAVCLHSRNASVVKLSTTQVQFRALDKAEITAYVASGEPRGKAGAYAIQGFGAVLVANLHGSYSGVVGLPLAETRQLLHGAGIALWQGVPQGQA
ncbi:Maf family nucleotide pyrophosphatase [Alcanivorax sp. JB21]|uniref:Maf family protein n=1 Tax=Alcanivorax limicola TaxID=2874102 RepID=UPI001CBF7FEC|nr:Maf family protein [Alcanivorax limicola]MBZ2189605.1 Maf family nucleotide pyrophosphatase [Alcanivorax limicola]